MLYFYCVTQCFSLSLITHKLKLKITDIIVAFSRILRGVIYVGFFYLLKKTSWQSSLRRLLQKVFQFVLVPVGALLIDFGSFVQHCFWITKCYASLLWYIQVTVPMSNFVLKCCLRSMNHLISGVQSRYYECQKAKSFQSCNCYLNGRALRFRVSWLASPRKICSSSLVGWAKANSFPVKWRKRSSSRDKR